MGVERPTVTSAADNKTIVLAEHDAPLAVPINGASLYDTANSQRLKADG